MIRRPPTSTRVRSSAASDVYKRQVVLLQRAWISDCLWGRRRHLEVAERRRLGEFEGGEDPALMGGALRALGDPPLARLQRHQVHALKLVAHDAPALTGGVLHDADQKQRQPAQLHVRTDAVLTEVEHRAQTPVSY